jgi:hypothetical protein
VLEYTTLLLVVVFLHQIRLLFHQQLLQHLPLLRYQAEGKIIPKTDQQDIKISSEILLDLGVANRSTKLKEFESMVEERLSNGEELRI